MKGQCVIATRIIKPLEIILSELPAVIGPYAWPGKHQCLECFRVITDVQVRIPKTPKIVGGKSIVKYLGF